MNEPLPRMFFSTFHYAACKAVGGDRWPAVLARLLEHPEEGPDTLGLQGLSFATLNEARHVAECIVHVAANSYIARARCVAAAAFLRSECDVWLTCDDDQFADEDTLRRLVTACRGTRGLVALPSPNRDGHTMCFRKVVGPTLYIKGHYNGVPNVWVHPTTPGALPLRRVDRIGQGLVAMHRAFVERLDRDTPSALRFRDRVAPDALDCPGIFLSNPLEGDWVGEDYWLCALAEKANLPMHVALEAPVQHERIVAKLDLEGRVMLQGQDRADTMSAAIARLNADAAASGAAP